MEVSPDPVSCATWINTVCVYSPVPQAAAKQDSFLRGGEKKQADIQQMASNETADLLPLSGLCLTFALKKAA